MILSHGIEHENIPQTRSNCACNMYFGHNYNNVIEMRCRLDSQVLAFWKTNDLSYRCSLVNTLCSYIQYPAGRNIFFHNQWVCSIYKLILMQQLKLNPCIISESNCPFHIKKMSMYLHLPSRSRKCTVPSTYVSRQVNQTIQP